MSVDQSAIASVLGISVEYKDLRGGAVLNLPQRIAVFAQGNTASNASYTEDKWQAESAAAGGSRYGFGSPIHNILRELMPDNGDGVGTIPVTVYPLKDHVSGVAAAGDVTPSGTASKAVGARLLVGGVLSEKFTVPAGAIAGNLADLLDAMAAACAAVLEMPADIANSADTELSVTAKWKGATGNAILVEVIEDEPSGVVWTITQPTGGLNNPSIADALEQVGNVWETLGINQMEVEDTDTLDLFADFGEGRWGELVRKPIVVFTGGVHETVTSAKTVPDARKTDRTNSLLMAPGSPELPFVVAARQVARIAKVANDNPPTDYCAQRATGLLPGADTVQWNFTLRDQANKAGVSTSEVVDGEVRLVDIVTFYHPTGEPHPAYRHVVDIVKLQNIIFNLDIEFAKQEWAGAPLIPDGQATTNPNARRPKDAKAAIAAILTALGYAAIISDPATAKKSITSNINSQNPKRLDMKVTVQLAGNTKIKSLDLYFGFYFGQQAAA